MQRRPVFVDELVDPMSEIVGPVGRRVEGRHATTLTTSTSERFGAHEVVVLVTTEGDELIIHAMPVRAVYRKLLDP
jgi:hypothetical protein